MMRYRLLGLITLMAALPAAAADEKTPTNRDQNEGELLYFEDFDGYKDGSPAPADWWVEGSVWTGVENGRLRINANPPGGKSDPGHACTAFLRQSFAGDLKVSFEAHVTTATTGLNNINFFLLYTDPAGKPLEDSRESRADGAYKKYHELNGYIFTYVNERGRTDEKARFRIRRCPGFELLSEAYTYEAKKEKTYHVEITRRGADLIISVDGNEILTATDTKGPWPEGLIGLRTFCTDLWWDNIAVTRLK